MIGLEQGEKNRGKFQGNVQFPKSVRVKYVKFYVSFFIWTERENIEGKDIQRKNIERERERREKE